MKTEKNIITIKGNNSIYCLRYNDLLCVGELDAKFSFGNKAITLEVSLDSAIHKALKVLHDLGVSFYFDIFDIGKFASHKFHTFGILGTAQFERDRTYDSGTWKLNLSFSHGIYGRCGTNTIGSYNDYDYINRSPNSHGINYLEHPMTNTIDSYNDYVYINRNPNCSCNNYVYINTNTNCSCNDCVRINTNTNCINCHYPFNNYWY